MIRQIPPVGLALLFACNGGGNGVDDPALVHTVQRSDLPITVREGGELVAARDTRVVSELEGRNTLTYLIPEGTVVQPGDRLAELDASPIEEKQTDQAITVAKSEAALEQARKSLEVMEKELLAAEKTAESRWQIAQIRAEKLVGQSQRADGPVATGTNREMIEQLEALIEDAVSTDAEAEGKYSELAGRVRELLGSEANLELKMGEMGNQILRQINEISLARADLEMAAETLRYSRTLEERGFITKNELDRDLINHQRRLSEVALAWSNLELLIHYTLPETSISTQQEVENAHVGLESVRATNAATRVRAAAELKASEAEFEFAKERLDEWTRQVESKVLRAPSRGLVVYGRWDWDEPVYEGMEVRQRQEIIILPDVSTMIAELDVHEAQIDKVVVDQPALVKVDAFPGRSFGARVTHVSTLPDPAPSYRRDVKVYKVVVQLDDDNSDGTLRPGMNATIEIDVGTLTDVVNVPLPALDRRDDEHFVWLASPEGPVARRVELGGHNLTHVEIVAGLRAGDRVHLVRPAGLQLPDDAPEAPIASEEDETLAAGAEESD